LVYLIKRTTWTEVLENDLLMKSDSARWIQLIRAFLVLSSRTSSLVFL